MQVLLGVLNSLQINLKLTLKTETMHIFHFQKVEIKYNNHRLSTQNYFKPTCTCLYMLLDNFLRHS